MLFTISLLGALSGCGVFSPCEIDTTEIFVSPLGNVQAIVEQENCGATTPYVTYIYLTDKSGKKSESELIFKASKLKDLSIQWEHEFKLVIKYNKARIHFFTNYWFTKIDGKHEEVEIEEGKNY